MAINIPSLFRDVIETPEQRQQRQMLERLGQAQSFMAPRGSVAALANPLASATFMNIAESQDRVKENLGGMLGLDMRDSSQKLSDALMAGDPNTPEGLRDLSKQLQNIFPAQSLGLLQAADEREQAEAERRLSEQATLQSIAESQTREKTSIQNRLLTEQRRNQELTGFELKEKLDKINLEEAEINLKRLKEGKGDLTDDEIFGAPEILPNGLIYYASKGGNTIVKDIGGNVLVGDEARKAMDEGFAMKTQQQRDIYQARRLGTESASIAADAFEKIGTNRIMIANLREAARLVEQGAATTDLEAFLKPLSQATSFLQTITGQLTLDQLSQVTMGALSEKELELLQASAAPSGFDKPAIIQWYRDKANATEKALAILDQQASYFSQPGATPGGWLELQKQERERQAQIEAASGTEEDGERKLLLDKVMGRDTSSQTQAVDSDEAALEKARKEILRGR